MRSKRSPIQICVIRDGQHIGTRDASGMSEDDIITMMVGRELTALYQRTARPRRGSCGSKTLDRTGGKPS